MTISEPIQHMHDIGDSSHRDVFELPREDAQFYIRSSVGEDEYPEVVQRARQVHGISYVGEGYFDKSGQTDDLSLAPELDGTRSDIDGKKIANYLIASRLDAELDEASATVRLLDIGPNGSLEDLPTYQYFAGTFSEHIKSSLNSILSLYGESSIREIGALGTTGRSGGRGSYELIRAMVQNSVIKEQVYGRPELYLASMTSRSLYPVLDFIGHDSAEILAESVKIFSNDPRSRDIQVTPVLIDLGSVIQNTADALTHSHSDFEAATLEAKLRFLTDGLSPDLYPAI